jgi:uncharacterized protein (DUF924 family)
MELAWLANEEPAIAIVVDKDTRKKVATTSATDHKQIFQRMIRFPLSREPIKRFDSGAETAFSTI